MWNLLNWWYTPFACWRNSWFQNHQDINHSVVVYFVILRYTHIYIYLYIYRYIYIYLYVHIHRWRFSSEGRTTKISKSSTTLLHLQGNNVERREESSPHFSHENGSSTAMTRECSWDVVDPPRYFRNANPQQFWTRPVRAIIYIKQNLWVDRGSFTYD